MPRRASRMLKIDHLTKTFGGLAAVSDVSTVIEEGRINAIIGPNGAGKTTFFNLISCVHKPTSGTITFNGQDVTSLRTDQVRSEEHTSELQSQSNLVCRLLLEKK